MKRIYIYIFIFLVSKNIYNMQNVKLDAVSVNTKNKALILLSKLGYRKLILECIKDGAYINCKDKHQKSPLHYAAINGDVGIVGLLINMGADINAQDEYGNTPLIFATYNGHINTVSLLLYYGADINIIDKFGNNAIFWAKHMKYTKTLNILENAIQKKDINKLKIINLGNNDNLYYPKNTIKNNNIELIKAVKNSNLQKVKELIKNGNCNINFKDEDGNTPLTLSILNNDIDITSFLLEHI